MLDLASATKADVALAQLSEELRASERETVECLTRAIGMHDDETGRHVNRIGLVAAFLGTKLGLDPDRVALLRASAPMHDVGKIATPDGILRKPGPLTDEEHERMESHARIGHKILGHSRSELLRMAAKIALAHHEHWDGGGYPQGLSGEEIPLEGRIVAVADVFDALLCDRCYRPGLKVPDVVATVRAGRGGHFDPRVADALLDNFEEALALRA